MPPPTGTSSVVARVGLAGFGGFLLLGFAGLGVASAGLLDEPLGPDGSVDVPAVDGSSSPPHPARTVATPRAESPWKTILRDASGWVIPVSRS
jgi:hypothetical protein